MMFSVFASSFKLRAFECMLLFPVHTRQAQLNFDRILKYEALHCKPSIANVKVCSRCRKWTINDNARCVVCDAKVILDA